MKAVDEIEDKNGCDNNIKELHICEIYNIKVQKYIDLVSNYSCKY